MQSMKGDMQSMKGDMQSMKGDMQSMKGDMQVMKEDIKALQRDVAELNHRTTNLELTLENETNRNIRLIAEGHLDLNRKLDDALKIENEKEMFSIRVNILENEVRKIKDQISRKTRKHIQK